ncbi:MAG: ubiquitin family protein [Clostridiales Family XIII bacterium]|nr:ubiquitin family protein [Clostridiales Family XIII bacterium]
MIFGNKWGGAFVSRPGLAGRGGRTPLRLIAALLLAMVFMASFPANAFAIQLYVNINIDTGGETLVLNVEPTDRIGDIKQQIEEQKEIPADEQILTYYARVLKDGDTLQDYSIQNGAALTLLTAPFPFSGEPDYIITNADEYGDFELAVTAANTAGEDFEDKTVELLADIDVTNALYDPEMPEDGIPFKGTFNGNGHLVFNNTRERQFDHFILVVNGDGVNDLNYIRRSWDDNGDEGDAIYDYTGYYTQAYSLNGVPTTATKLQALRATEHPFPDWLQVEYAKELAEASTYTLPKGFHTALAIEDWLLGQIQTDVADSGATVDGIVITNFTARKVNATVSFHKGSDSVYDTAKAYIEGMRAQPDISQNVPSQYILGTESAAPSRIGFAGKQWLVIGDLDGGIYASPATITLLLADGYTYANLQWEAGREHVAPMEYLGHGSLWEGTWEAGAIDQDGKTAFASNRDAYSDADGAVLKPAMGAAADSVASGDRDQILMRVLCGNLYDGSDPDDMAGRYSNFSVFWPLSNTEASLLHAANRIFGDGWWTRSGYTGVGDPEGAPVAYVDENGIIKYGSSADLRLVRPAVNLDLAQPLFASANTGGKSGAVGELAPYALPSVAEPIKFTTTDSDTGRLDLAVAEQSAKASYPGGTVSLAYMGAKTAANKYVSCVVEDGGGKIVYYGKLSQGAGGTASVPIPSDMALGSYTIKLFNEEINAENYGDFISAPIAIALTVEAAPAGSDFTYTALRHFGEFTGTGDRSALLDADHTKFAHLYMQGELGLALVAPECYQITQGSTAITLKEAYLKTFANGTYYLTAEFTNGKAVAGLKLDVNVAAGAGGNTPPDGGGDAGAGASNVPNTGDGMNPLLWFAAALSALLGLSCLMFILRKV